MGFFQPFFTPTSIGPAVSTLSPPPTLAATPVANNGAGILPFLIDPHLKPYSQNWTLGVQHELPGQLLLEVNYVGSRGARLLRLVDGNPPQPALVAQLEAFCVPHKPNESGLSHAQRLMRPIDFAVRQSQVRLRDGRAAI